MNIRFDSTLTRDLAHTTSREWLESNGLGGWSSSTISGAHTRRYHGLLVVATDPPVGRVVLLSHLDESLVFDHNRLELCCGIFPSAVHPQGHQSLHSFALSPVPTWTYANSDFTLHNRLAMLNGEHAVVVCYELERVPGPIYLELRPFFAGRDYHYLMQANDGVAQTADFADDTLSFGPFPTSPLPISTPLLQTGKPHPIGTTISITRAKKNVGSTPARTSSPRAI